MKRIMFVCHGNICRSPMAEFITKKIVKDLGLAHDYEIVSRATSPEEYGNDIYPPAARELSRHGIPYEKRAATLVLSSDYEKYDVFALMDERNARNISRYFKSDPKGKISKLLLFVGESRDVCDPYYSGDFGSAYSDILRGCIGLLCSVDSRITKDKIKALSIY